jgi:hypothetical protein
VWGRVEGSGGGGVSGWGGQEGGAGGEDRCRASSLPQRGPCMQTLGTQTITHLREEEVCQLAHAVGHLLPHLLADGLQLSIAQTHHCKHTRNG